MSAVLDYVRSKDPRFNDVSDEDLTGYILDRKPEFVQDPEFSGLAISQFLNKKIELPPTPKNILDSAQDYKFELPELKEQRRFTPEEGQQAYDVLLGKESPAIPSEISSGPTREISTIADTTRGGGRVALASLEETLNEFPEAIKHPTQPLFNLVEPLTPEELARINASEDTKTKIAAGIFQSTANMANFFVSPLGLSTLGIGVMPRAAQKILAGVFATHMVTAAPEIATELGSELGKPETERDVQKIAELTTDAVYTTGFATLAAKHAATPNRILDAKALARELNVAKLQPRMTPEEAAQIRLGLPSRAKPEMLPELQRTQELANQAVSEATQLVKPPGQQSALEQLKAQTAEIVPGGRQPLERPGGGEATGGKISFMRGAEAPMTEQTRMAFEAERRAAATGNTKTAEALRETIQEKATQDAIREQGAGESVLGEKRSEVGLPEVVEGKRAGTPEVATKEAPKEIDYSEPIAQAREIARQKGVEMEMTDIATGTKTRVRLEGDRAARAVERSGKVLDGLRKLIKCLG